MSAKVFVKTVSALIEFIENSDLDGFKNYLSEDEYLMFEEPVEFATESYRPYYSYKGSYIFCRVKIYV